MILIAAQRKLRVLDGKLAVSTLHGMAQGTQRNFKTHINTYVTFCIEHELDLFPASVLQTCRYLQYLSEFHETVESSKSYVSGVQSLHQLFGFPPPESSDYLFQLTVSGIRHDKAHMVKQAYPVTPEIMAAISMLVEINDKEQLSAWITLLMGFYLLFRKSNLVPDSAISFDKTKQLTRANFYKFSDCYLVKAYWAKNLQYRDRCLDIPLLPNPYLRLCPVYWLDLYFALVPALGMEHAFVVQKQGTRVPLSYPVLTKWMKVWVERLGWDPKEFSSHSLRRGGVQWVVQCGLSHQVIKLLGDWKSQAYMCYLDLSLQDKYDAMLTFTMSMNQ